MSDMTSSTAPLLRPESAIANAQRGLACWSKAYTELAHGLMTSGMAQLELARSLYASEAGDWSSMKLPASPHDAAASAVAAARTRYDSAVQACRKINDDLTEHFFTAAETLADVWEEPSA